MEKRLKNKIYIVIFTMIIYMILLLTFGKLFGAIAVAVKEHPDPGDVIEIPDFRQWGASHEEENISWDKSTNQYKVNQLWISQGMTKDEHNWAYVTVAGEKWFLIAVAPVFGDVGDYLKVDTKAGETYYCMIGDEKGDDAQFFYEGIHWGHYDTGPPEDTNTCNILEMLLYLNDGSSIPHKFMGTLGEIARIQNGGNYFEHPEGPVNLSGSSSGARDETSTIIGVIGSWIRNVWSSLDTFIDNHTTGRQDVTVLYQFKDDGDEDSSLGSAGNGDILSSCELVTKMLLDRGCTYSRGEGLISGDIDKQLYQSNRFCCATYVAAVLYYSGLLTADQINAYNYHWTGSGGIPDMLAAAGWKQVSPSEAQPGDVVNDYEVHAMIYAGDGKIWDETSCVVMSNGRPPSGTTYEYDISGCQVWRAP
mgnify:CR=1 FL=1